MPLRIGIVGAGHVGLPTAAVFARFGHQVTVYDSDESKVEDLRARKMPFFEPGLEAMMNEGVDRGLINYTTEVEPAVVDADAVFICVGTPPRISGEADLLAVEHSAQQVATGTKVKKLVVVEKSTVPAGTAARLTQVLERQNPEVEFAVVSNPEFLKEGTAVEDSLEPDRIVVGTTSEHAKTVMRQVYAPLIDAGCPYIEIDPASAEIAKHASNAFLALKISYANALARICELSGADVVQVADVMGADPRIGRSFLNAGLGFGGSCFPKDLAAFRRLSERLGYKFELLDEVARINVEAVTSTFEKLESSLWNLSGKNVTLLGLSFKQGTDDVRFSPALELARLLIDAGVTVTGHDPEANATAKREVPQLTVVDDPYEAASGSHAIVICTDWDEFRKLDLPRLRSHMRFSLLVDARNLIDPSDAVASGFEYLPLGRPQPKPPGTS